MKRGKLHLSVLLLYCKILKVTSQMASASDVVVLVWVVPPVKIVFQTL